MKFLKSLTLKKVIIFLIILLVAYLVIDILMNPQDIINGFKEGYNAAKNSR